ncbi:glutathione S-transferase family protein [Pseudomaricurvus sp. HS19]|uniref:glutathione S-transferase family protein n=1 Tax=Pseudomaricurvus sp. HS19 TaxID=2692626 RepID=UPI0013680192|nr:glutathione S-transferase family protein [Pseudomaricurvus sp. HS19]MYM64851.1 glutathione S-transferase family protein [Pseudomaricurvus sp. HS19]
MGVLQQGEWRDQWYDTESTGGAFQRQESRFRNQISADGSSGFKAEAGRYHLYVSLACPWAHRTLIMRRLKKLEGLIGVTVVEPLMLENGWEFGEGGDDLYGLDYLYQLYLKADPGYEGRVTVPVLWDKQTRTIVNNESAEIIRIFNSAFDHLTGDQGNYCPASLRNEIDAINSRVYDSVNNGVYKAGFATDQAVYESAVTELFAALDWLEQRLENQDYLVGNQLTEADIRLFTTLVRFDPVYVGHFKCNLRTLASYPNLSAYLRGIYHLPGVAETVNFTHIKQHYYGSHKTINPTGIVPLGPLLEL